MPTYDDFVALYDQLITKNSEIEREGKIMPYTSLNGHMFSFLDKEGKMGLRLNKEDLEKFLQNHNTQFMIQHGRTMKEYATDPKSLLMDHKKFSVYLQKSLNYVSNLKPKPTKKKK